MGGAQHGVISMNRRPKLSLVSNRELHKKQALSFETGDQTETKQSPEFEAKAPDAAPEIPPRGPAESEQRAGDNRRDQQTQNSAWPNGRLLVKVAIAVATVAVSLYLVKRRLL